MTSIKEKMTSKKGKTLLFATIIAAMVIPISATFTEDVFASADIKTQKMKNLEAHEKLTHKMMDRDLFDVPLVASFIDESTGKLMVIVDKDGEKSRSQYYEIVKGIVGIDVEFELNLGYFERESCASRSSNCDPLYGGIAVYSSSTGDEGSITIGATDDSSNIGFVMSGHVVGDGVTGIDITQGGTTDIVGEVITNPTLHNRYSDAAFVELTSSEGNTDEIYYNSSNQYTVTGTGTASYLTRVLISGISVGIDDGYVVSSSTTVYDNYGTLLDQQVATYDSFVGDSGAPIFSYTTNPSGNVTLYGIHVGKLCLEFVEDIDECDEGDLQTVFSKWTNVVSELDLDTIP